MIVYIVLLLLPLLVLWLRKADSDLILMICELVYSFTKKNTLAGKVVWITGASSGIGEALAHELASRGCKLVLSGRREDVLKAVKDKCVEIGRKYSPSYKAEDVLVLSFDLLNTKIHNEMTDAVMEHFSQIDVLVNNAGRTQRFAFADSPHDVIQEVINLNLMAQISLTKAVLPSMITRKQGHIVGMSSVAGKFSPAGSTIYCAAKHALNGFLHSLRCEVRASGISVTVVCPGPVKTPLIMNAFTKEAGVSYGEEVEEISDEEAHGYKVSAKRCAFLTAIGIDAKLQEIWISQNPVLLVTYLSQYIPTLALYLLAVAGSKGQGTFRDPGLRKKLNMNEKI